MPEIPDLIRRVRDSFVRDSFRNNTRQALLVGGMVAHRSYYSNRVEGLESQVEIETGEESVEFAEVAPRSHVDELRRRWEQFFPANARPILHRDEQSEFYTPPPSQLEVILQNVYSQRNQRSETRNLLIAIAVNNIDLSTRTPMPFNNNLTNIQTGLTLENLKDPYFEPKKIEIYDPQGKLIRTMYVKGDSGFYSKTTWDAKDENGKPVPQGVYSFKEIIGDKVIKTGEIKIEDRYGSISKLYEELMPKTGSTDSSTNKNHILEK